MLKVFVECSKTEKVLDYEAQDEACSDYRAQPSNLPSPIPQPRRILTGERTRNRDERCSLSKCTYNWIETGWSNWVCHRGCGQSTRERTRQVQSSDFGPARLGASDRDPFLLRMCECK